MITLPSLFKEPRRFSAEKRPIVGSTVVYSHAIKLLLSEFVPETKDIGRDEVFNGAEVKVIENRPNVIEVMFDGAKQTDLVSPEFLTTGELTVVGERILHRKGMLAGIRKLIIGVAEA